MTKPIDVLREELDRKREEENNCCPFIESSAGHGYYFCVHSNRSRKFGVGEYCTKKDWDGCPLNADTGDYHIIENNTIENDQGGIILEENL